MEKLDLEARSRLRTMDMVAGSVMQAAGIDFEGHRIEPDTGTLVPESRIEAVTRLVGMDLPYQLFSDGHLERLRASGFEV